MDSNEIRRRLNDLELIEAQVFYVRFIEKASDGSQVSILGVAERFTALENEERGQTWVNAHLRDIRKLLRVDIDEGVVEIFRQMSPEFPEVWPPEEEIEEIEGVIVEDEDEDDAGEDDENENGENGEDEESHRLRNALITAAGVLVLLALAFIAGRAWDLIQGNNTEVEPTVMVEATIGVTEEPTEAPEVAEAVPTPLNEEAIKATGAAELIATLTAAAPLPEEDTTDEGDSRLTAQAENTRIAEEAITGTAIAVASRPADTATPTETPTETVTPTPTIDFLALRDGDEYENDLVAFSIVEWRYNDRIGPGGFQAPVAVSFDFLFENKSGQTILLRYEEDAFIMEDNLDRIYDCIDWNTHDEGYNQPIEAFAETTLTFGCGLDRQLDADVTSLIFKISDFSSLGDMNWIVDVVG